MSTLSAGEPRSLSRSLSRREPPVGAAALLERDLERDSLRRLRFVSRERDRDLFLLCFPLLERLERDELRLRECPILAAPT